MIQPGEDAAFVCRMEDVLDLYHEPYDPQRPVICFDESNKTLHLSDLSLVFLRDLFWIRNGQLFGFIYRQFHSFHPLPPGPSSFQLAH